MMSTGHNNTRYGFLSTLEVRKVREAGDTGRARWKILSTLRYRSKLLQRTIDVPATFETDFSSVPRVPFAYLLAGDTAHASAAVHDFLCTYEYPKRITWAAAAQVFLEAMAHEGVPRWRRTSMFVAVILSKPFEIWRKP